jgi:uncharacterized SAM-binding protein YcdF (DUF218 family)
MSWLATNLIAALFLPPVNVLLLGGAGLVLWRRRPMAARWLIGASLTFLWLLSTPYVSDGLLRTLEGAPGSSGAMLQPADAIVVLGAGTHFDAPEYGHDTVSADGLVRVRYAAKLQHDTGKPLMVTGGAPEGSTLAEAQQMKDVLEHEFHVPVKWTEDESRNTAENAAFCYRKLAPLGIRRIYLVTHAWHMPRAAAAFRKAGFEVIPAPTDYARTRKLGIMDFVPSARALLDSRQFVHETLGLLWYFLKS